MNELDLFTAALGIHDAQTRAAYLDEHCQGNSALRQRLEELLNAFRQADEVLPEVPVIDPHVTEMLTRQKQDHLIGTLIAGKYKLLQQIGEGGMGSVWMADQTEPVKRRVAVKLIRTEQASSKTILARFEAERQAIALMDHPNIAKLLDAGATENSSPYFVMELVKGVPLTEFCDQHKFSIPDRLSLFMQICSAVQHAHQKGIIHRDLKPSNILVELHDDKPVPKVIDFGLAKATSGIQLTENTLFTGFGTVAGTPLYMAPEQAKFNAVDIDTRADIYAMGVILYELLTGTTPISRETIKKAALDEMMKLIREQEAPTPSSRLSSSETKPTVAANRHTEPQKLGRYVKGELDWIVMKALSKERDRRYETANGFARDIERFLNHEAVQAGPVSAAYRLRKFVKRNKGKVIAAGLVASTLLLGMIGTTWGFFEAKRQEQLTSDRAEGERQAKLEAEAQREQAQKRLNQIEKANDILGSIFENLDPKEIAKKELPLQVILVEKLDKAVAQLEGESIGDPLVVAAMQVKFGLSLLGLGEPDKSIKLLEKARSTYQAKLGTDHPLTIRSMHHLAGAYQAAGKLDRAVSLFEETLKLAKAKLGPDHPDTLGTTNNLAVAYKAAGKFDRALPLFEEAVNYAKTKFGPRHTDTLTSMNNLAALYYDAGKLDLALPLFEEILTLRKAKLSLDDPDTLTSMNNLAMAYRVAGKLNLALPLFEETLKLMKDKLGFKHPLTLVCMNGLAVAYQANGQLDRALPLFEETLKLQKAKLGLEHHDTITTMNNLALAYQVAGRRDLALLLHEESLMLTKDKLGPVHFVTLTSMNNLAMAYQATENFDLALPLYEETLLLMKENLGSSHPNTLNVMNNLASAYQKTGKRNLAISLYQELIGSVRKTLPPDSPQLSGQLAAIGFSLLQGKAFREAEALLRDCLTIREKKEPEAWTTFNTQSLLGGALLGQKKYTDAEPLLLKGYEGMKAREKTIPPQASPRLPEALDRLIQLYTKTNKPDEVKRWQAEKEKISRTPEKK